MSHVDSGMVIKDIEALATVVKAQCPDLEIVKQKTFKTWVAEHGTLAGDYALPWVYQLKMIAAVAKKLGVAKVRAIAKAQSVDLPQDLLSLEQTPLTLEQQNALTQNPDFKDAYTKVVSHHVGQDAEYTIRHKTDKGAYEIGLVPHPTEKGEYIMLTDFWQQGKGILRAKGVGQYNHQDNSWGNELKKSYSVLATEKSVKQQVKDNPNFVGYKKVQMPDGRVEFKVEVQD